MLRAYASEFGETREISLDDAGAADRDRARRRSARGGWFGYVAGVAWAMLGAGHALRGADLAIAGEVPPGAGLSSSAALEIAVARALARRADLPWDTAATARLAQQAEHEFAGVVLRHHGPAVGRVGARGLRAPDRLPVARDPRRARSPTLPGSSSSTAACDGS